MHVFEDYIENIGSEDIAPENVDVQISADDISSGYSMSIQFYTSLFTYQGRDDLIMFIKRIEHLARTYPQLNDETVTSIVGYGSNLDSYNGLVHII